MKVRITTKEDVQTGMLGGETKTLIITCKIDLTPEEERLYQLMDRRSSHDDLLIGMAIEGDYFNKISLREALETGDSCIVQTISDLKGGENRLIAHVRAFKAELDFIRDYEANKDYVIDITSPED